MVKVWQWAEDCDYMRFHYVVHSGTICDMFWHQGNDEQTAGAPYLLLYTVTEGGRLYVWHSTAASDSTRPSTACSGIRFAMAGTLEISQDTPSQRGSADSVTSRDMEAAATGYTSSSQPETSSHSALSAPDSKPVDLELPNEPAATSSKASSSSASEQPAAATPVSRTATTVLDRVYAVFSDGSLDMWEIHHPNRFSSLSSAKAIMCTRASSTRISPPPQPPSDAADSLTQSLLWPGESGAFTLAIADIVGHIFILDTPAVSGRDLLADTLHLRYLWDGHKEPIFHISVDPYSQRIATHSTEGELLIWETVDSENISLPISRKVALDESLIHTIAWAPAEYEFIAATDKRVYRLKYDLRAEQWDPCDFSLPQMEPYDRIFTYPAGDAGENPGEKQPTNAYYISTVAKATRSVQTWFVAGPNERLEYVSKSELKQQFDRASRVMPVSHPFFSRDNIMATFDTSAGKLHIWGIRAAPKIVWFCAKEHRLPCLNVDMIRYNSIDKAAIVSTDEDGLQSVTIWVFSSASRRSHYLPAGTIYPKHKSDRVQEVRWHLTEYAQTYLGIQWDDRIDIYCQERNIDSGWICAYTISAAEFGPDKRIGSFSFTAAGEPTFAIAKQLFIYTQALEKDKTISDLAYEEHGELPLIHPFILTELMSWGKIEAVKRLLSLLHDYVRELSIDRSRAAALPLIPLQDLLSLDTPGGGSQSSTQPRATNSMFSKYADLFGSGAGLGDDVLTMDSASPDFEQFTQEKADFVAEKLTEIKIKGLNPIDQARLLSIVGTIAATQIKDQPIDSMGVRYLVKLQLLELENKRARTAAELPYRELNWALHSNSQAILLQMCLQRHASTGLTWESARQMGLFVWLSNNNALQAEVEKMARNIFIVEGRDPTKCAIFYLALKKQRLLHGLWRTAHNHPEHSKMVAFLAHDFTEARWKTAAAKNAYVLLSRQRYFDAATFFLLSGKLSDAAQVCVTQLKDFQLAITICRCYEGDSGPVLKDMIWKHVLPDAFTRQDRWLASLAFGIIHRYDLVLQSLTDDLHKLGGQIGVDAELSGYSTMNVLDTELLILYRSMLNYSTLYRAPLVTQAELIAQTMTIFECLGAPIMSLVVLEWWRKELFDITKRSAKSVLMTPSANLGAGLGRENPSSLDSGIPDMSAFAGFAGFGSASAQKPAAVDPMSTGLLSMDSFGSKFSNMSTGGNTPASKSTRVNGDSQESVNTSGTLHQQQSGRASTDESSMQEIEDESLLAVDIEDTPVQYACR
ncbi:regulator of (H+)-ATPase in vacuolar membrane, partial [Coemansia erecta]